MDRRLTTVLAADIVGYSALMDHDREGTIAALKSFREETLQCLLEDHDEMLIKSMGDGWIAEFKSTSDAADCAIAIQSSQKPDSIKLRISIQTGEVVTDGDDIFGEGINFASRLEALAEPDQVLISDTSHNGLDRGDASQFDGGEQTELKNITRRTGVWCWPKGCNHMIA